MADEINFGPLASAEDAVRIEAARQGVDPNLAAAVARQESGAKQNRVSPKGAVGTMQLMPSTAAGLGVNPNIESENIRGGVTYLHDMLQKYKGDVPKALAAYNAGPGRVDSGKPLPAETKNYVAAVALQAGKPTEIDFGPLATQDQSATPPAQQPSAPPHTGLAKSDQPGFLSRSLIQTVSGQDVAEMGREKVAGALKSILPKSMQGSYVTELADEISKAGPEMINFVTSPVGLGLTAAHFFPASAPFAAVADIAMGGRQALEAIPDTIDAVTHINDPHKVGRAIIDVLGAYAGLKGGSRVAQAMGEIPASTGEGLSAAGKVKAMAGAYGDAFRGTGAPPAPPSESLRARLESAVSDSDKEALIADAEQPKTLRQKFEKSLYDKPVIRSVVNVLAPKVSQPEILGVGQDLVNDYAGMIADEENKARRVKDWIERNVPKEEQNVRKMGFAMEGDLPESELSPQAREGLRQARELNVSRDDMLRDAGVDEDQFRDPQTYIRHYWDFDDPGEGGKKYMIATRMMNDPSFRARTVGSLKLGMTPEEEGGFGLTPKYENVGDIFYRRHMEGVRTIANQQFANKLRDYGLIVDPTKANVRSLGHWGVMDDASALKRAVYSGTSESGDTVLREKPVLVHPDIEMAVKAIFDEPFRGGLVNALNQLTSFSKQIGVGFSMFHNNAMSEVSQAQAVGAGGLSAIPRVAKAIAWPLDPEFLKGVRNAIWEVRGKVAPEAPPDVRLSRQAAEPWLKAGLTFKSAESESAAIDSWRNLWDDKGPVLKALSFPIRQIGNVQYVFNRSLFDYYLPGQMLHSAEHLFSSEMNRLGPEATPDQVSTLRREIADHVNRSYGADNMQRLLLTPKAQQALRFTLFAPQWTLSNLRVLSKGFETTTGSRLTSKYIAGAALTYFLTSQLANYALSDWSAKHSDDPNAGRYFDEGANEWKRGGHFTWENPGDPVKLAGKYVPGLTDNAANIYLGQNPDGSQRYIMLGKAWREPFHWMMAPIETLGGKLSLPLRQAWVQLSKVQPGSGFPVINSKLTEEQQTEQRIGSAAEMVTPFSARQLLQKLERAVDPKVFREPDSTQYVGLPARKGASYFKAVQDLRDALESDRPDLAQKVLENAALNKINPKSVENELRGRLKSEARTEAGKQPAKAPAAAAPAQPVNIEFGPLKPQE